MNIFWGTWAYLAMATLILYLSFFLEPKTREVFRKGVWLDLWIGIFVYACPILLGTMFGLSALLVAILAQISFLLAFCRVHSAALYWKRGLHGGRLLNTLGKSLGKSRVLLGFISTLFAIPVFLVIRFGQVFVYPMMIWLLGFPRYRTEEWIQLSRQKFEGLIGIDLLWCLYCEWAAGVYALGGEMVRNNESFWCPIRFYDNKHCENCKVDFPDLKEWIPQTGKIEEVETLLARKYPPGQKTNAWYEHPSRKS